MFSEQSIHLNEMDSWISKCFQLRLKWDMVSALPARKRRADNELEVETLGIWSKHMDISINGEQTTHNSAAFRQCHTNSWNPIITIVLNCNCYLLTKGRIKRCNDWSSNGFMNSFVIIPWTHVNATVTLYMLSSCQFREQFEQSSHFCTKETYLNTFMSGSSTQLYSSELNLELKCIQVSLQH